MEEDAAGVYLATVVFGGQLAKSSAAGNILPLALSLARSTGSGLGVVAIAWLRAFKAKMLFELLRVRLQKNLTVPV